MRTGILQVWLFGELPFEVSTLPTRASCCRLVRIDPEDATPETPGGGSGCRKWKNPANPISEETKKLDCKNEIVETIFKHLLDLNATTRWTSNDLLVRHLHNGHTPRRRPHKQHAYTHKGRADCRHIANVQYVTSTRCGMRISERSFSEISAVALLSFPADWQTPSPIIHNWLVTYIHSLSVLPLVITYSLAQKNAIQHSTHRLWHQSR